MIRFKASDIISILALIISCVSLYLTGFYQKRDLSVTWGEMSFVKTTPSPFQTGIYKLPIPLVFMNKGTRTEAITRIRMRIGARCHFEEELGAFSIEPNSNKVVSLTQQFDKKRILECITKDEDDLKMLIDYVNTDGNINSKLIRLGDVVREGYKFNSWPEIIQDLPCDKSNDEILQSKECTEGKFKPVQLLNLTIASS
jgi:hypothetical protein